MYDVVRLKEEQTTRGGGATFGCGDPMAYDYSFARPLATRYRIRVRYRAAGAAGPDSVVEGEASMEQAFAALPSRLVVSEFRTRGPNGSSDQFIELLNDSLSPARVVGFIGAGNRTSNTGVPVNGGTIGPGCHFLITGPGYSGAVRGDASMPEILRDDGNIRFGSAFFVDQYHVGDLVGMDGSWQYYEGAPLAPFDQSNTDRSYQRTGPDTNNNARDFTMGSPSTPQSSSSCGNFLSPT
jgi:hypothetical protein